MQTKNILDRHPQAKVKIEFDQSLANLTKLQGWQWVRVEYDKLKTGLSTGFVNNRFQEYSAILMYSFTGPPVSSFPECTLLADLAIWIIDTFLMRTTNNAIGHNDRLAAVLGYESQ